MVKSIASRVFVVLALLSAVFTIVVAARDPELLPWVILSTIVGGAAVVALLFQEAIAARVSREEANSYRILLATATDNDVQTRSRQRTALGALAIEMFVTENFLALVSAFRGRLEEIATTATEVEAQPREAGLRQLRRAIDVWVNDRVFVEDHHAALKLLVPCSRRAEGWKRLAASFKQVGNRVGGLVQQKIAQALTKPQDEDAETKHARRSALLRELALHARNIASEMEQVAVDVQRLRGAVRVELLRVL